MGTKRYSKLQSLVAQSDSEIKGIKDEASFAPTNTEMIVEDWKDDNDELSRINEEDNANDVKVSKMPSSHTKSVTSSSSSDTDSKSSSDSSVSNKFVINIKEDKYEVKQEVEEDDKSLNISEKSRRLCMDDLDSDNDLTQMQEVRSAINLKEVIKINQPPNLNGEDESSDKASTLSSNDSSYTSSKVSVNRSFIVSFKIIYKLWMY